MARWAEGEGTTDVIEHTHSQISLVFFFAITVCPDTGLENLEILVLDLDSGFKSAFTSVFCLFVCLFRHICTCLNSAKMKEASYSI